MRSAVALGWLVGTGVLAATACDGRGRAPEAARPGGEAAALPAGPAERSEGEEFAVEARHDAAATVGQATTVVFIGTGKGGWHVNVEYPAKLEALAVDGFTVAKTVLRKEDAAQFDEQQLRFDVPLTPTRAGELPVQFKFKFGLCSGDRCVTREAVLGWTYVVGEG
jgi:hypothetical protein